MAAMALKRIYDVVVIGSGPGGLAAAVAAKREGAEDVLILDRDVEMGGILQQCIHHGFGLEHLKEDLPGPMYAQRFADEAMSLGVEALLDTMVLELTPDRRITATSRWAGLIELEARSVVLAMGCRERTRAQIQVPGTRPAGVYTAGTAQRFVNVEGFMPGRRFVILGSGDIGMIMARRLTFEGAETTTERAPSTPMAFSTSSAACADHSEAHSVTSSGPTVKITSWATASIA